MYIREIEALLLPVIRYVADRNPHDIEHLVSRMSEEHNDPSGDAYFNLKNGHDKAELSTLVKDAVNFLEAAQLIVVSDDSLVSITSSGIELLKREPEYISITELMKVNEFEEFYGNYTNSNNLTDEKMSKKDIKHQLAYTHGLYQEFGGWSSFWSGDWFLKLLEKSFKNYHEKANVEYFEEKYGTNDKDKIRRKLIAVAVKNAAMAGAVTGAVVSADEIVGIATGGEGGVGLPANVALAGAAVCGEAILVTRIQLQLIANLAKLYEVPLDIDDPEDILTIIAYALGGSASEAAGRVGMAVGKNAAGRAAKAIFRKERLKLVQRLAKKIGVKILQRNIVKYTVPAASIAIGGTWNYVSTRTIAKVATNHFKGNEDGPDAEATEGTEA